MKIKQIFMAMVAFSIASASLHAAADNNLLLTKVCLDPGHGGKDPGTVSRDGKTFEKDIALDISLRLKSKLEAHPEKIKVTMTRDKDVFIPLAERARISRAAEAQLFISIHINGVPGTSPSGYSTFVLSHTNKDGKDLLAANHDLCRRENSVVQMEENFETNYHNYDASDPASNILSRLEQNANLTQSISFGGHVNDAMGTSPLGRYQHGVVQDNFYVLRRNTRIAVLLELGFITSATDLAVLRSAESREKIAENLYKAFVSFKKEYDEGVSVSSAAQPSAETAKPVAEQAAKPAAEPASPEAGESAKQNAGMNEQAKTQDAQSADGAVLYGQQVLVTGKKMSADDPFFKGYEVREYRAGKMYKYIIAVTPDPAKAKSQAAALRKQYPDSFTVKIDGGSISIFR